MLDNITLKLKNLEIFKKIFLSLFCLFLFACHFGFLFPFDFLYIYIYIRKIH